MTRIEVCFAVSILCCGLFLQVSSQTVNDVDSVVMVNLIFRHGDRTPVDPYPNDPYRNASFWPIGFGQLTDIGKQQHFKFGQYLRKRYGHLLPPTYNLKDVLVRSTDVDRTLMSAESHLAGLYPPDPEWEPELPWQPIPVHTVPEKLDELLAMKRPCPRYEKEFKHYLNSPEITKINEKYQDLYQYLTEHSGKEVHDPIQVQYINNNLYIERLKNLTLPEWTKKVYPDQMKYLADFSFSLQAGTKLLKRLKGGPLLKEMIKHMEEKVQAKLEPDRKMFIYSAHDTTVSNMLMTLGVFDYHSPPYTAAIFLELHRSKEGKYAISVLYRNQTTADPTLLQIPGCSVRCPLDQFVSLMRPLIPEDWESECGLRHLDAEVEDALLLEYLSAAVVIGSGLMMLMMLALIVLAILLFRQKSELPRYRLLRMEEA